LGRNQIADFGEKFLRRKKFSGSSGIPEDENRSEIAQLMPTDPMVYNALIHILNCGNARISFKILENRIFFAPA
jgi:hypothetical protein